MPDFESWMPADEPEPAGSEEPSEPFERAVRDYCRAVLPEAAAIDSAADVIAAYRAAAGEAQDAAALSAITRLMVAVSLPDRSSPADRRAAVRASIGSESRCTCRETAPFLAALANGNIQPREQHALERHLAECAGCRALRERIDEADAVMQAALAGAEFGAE